MTRRIRFETWDVFTKDRFAGNPLAVVPDASDILEDELITIAREFNLSETVFILPAESSLNAAALRIFTPGAELAFAGHPTIGAAHSIAASRGRRDGFRLELRSGVFPIAFDAHGAAFVNPNRPKAWPTDISRDRLAAAVGIAVDDIVAAPMIAGAPTPFLIAEVRAGTLKRLVPDLTAIARLKADVFLVARNADDPDSFRARMFAPGLGIAEDPATGGAACALPAYIAASAGVPDAAHEWTVIQGVEMGRPSRIGLAFKTSGGEVGPVRVAGAAVMVQKGELLLGS